MCGSLVDFDCADLDARDQLAAELGRIGNRIARARAAKRDRTVGFNMSVRPIIAATELHLLILEPFVAAGQASGLPLHQRIG
ncbi:MAG: hypothetical protein ACKVP3_21580 [Hyphomicrobiaceae bacterium]